MAGHPCLHELAMDMLRALETFLRIAETGSFSAVARESNMTPSAVTRLVGQLEDHFDVRLFHRTTRHLSLTEDGQDLLEQARPIVDAASELKDSIGDRRAAPAGRVRVGLTAGAARLITSAMADLFSRYPGLSVEFVVREQFTDMIEDRLDLAMHVGERSDASVVTRSVGAFGYALVASPVYLERRGAPSTPEALREHSCLVLESGAGSRHWRFLGPGGPYEVEVTSRFSANSSDVVRQSALSGHGIALLAEPQVVDDILGARLYRLLRITPPKRARCFSYIPRAGIWRRAREWSSISSSTASRG